MDEHDVNILVPSPDKKVRNGGRREREGARERELGGGGRGGVRERERNKHEHLSFSFRFQSDIITITGPRKNCDEAKKGLERRLQQLEAEKEERVSHFFRF